MKRLRYVLTSLTAAVTICHAEVQPQSQRVEIVGGNTFLRLQGNMGRTYFFQQSRLGAELKEWDWLPLVRSGDGGQISIPITRVADKRFYRLQYTDQPVEVGQTAESADFDGDNLGNLAEVSLHSTNPLAFDTDKDLLPDGFETTYGLNPNVSSDAANLFPGSDLTYLEVHQSGLSTNPGSTLEDLDGDLISNDEDAGLKQKLIDWKRTPAASYAVIDLGMNSLGPIGGNGTVVNAVLNNKGQVCADASSVKNETTPSVWLADSLPVEWQSLADFDSASSGDKFKNEGNLSFGDSGVISGHMLKISATNPGENAVVVTWANFSSLPAITSSNSGIRTTIRYARFEHEARIEEIDNPDDQTPDYIPNVTITAPGFSFAEKIVTPASSSRIGLFSNYYYAPHISRTGKIILERFDESDLPRLNGVPVPAQVVHGISADPNNLDLVATTASHQSLADLATHRHRNGSWEKMPLPGIMDMNASGLGIIFPSHQIWRNGGEIRLDEMLKDSGWEKFKVEQVNKPGQLLGSARRVGGVDFLPVLLVPSVIEQYDFETAKTSDGIFSITPADPRPEVEIHVAGTRVNTSGQLEVRVTGKVRDRLSEVLAGPRISELRFSVNGT